MSKNQTRKKKTRWLIIAEVIVLAAVISYLAIAHPFAKPPEEQPAAAEKWTVTQYGNENQYSGSMFYTLSSDKGHLIFVDSGYETNVDLMRSLIEQNGGRLDMWILTHPHKDHVNGFIIFVQQGYAGQYDIGKVVYETYPDKLVSQAPEIDQFTHSAFLQTIDMVSDKEAFREGSEYTVGDLNIKFYNAWSDELYDSITGDSKKSFNSYSGAFMVSAGPEKKNKMFFGGDIKNKTIKILVDKYRSELGKAAYLQAPHHGREDDAALLCEVLEPELVLIDRAEDDPDDMTRTLRDYLKKESIPYEMLPPDSRSLDLF